MFIDKVVRYQKRCLSENLGFRKTFWKTTLKTSQLLEGFVNYLLNDTLFNMACLDTLQTYKLI